MCYLTRMLLYSLWMWIDVVFVLVCVPLLVMALVLIYNAVECMLLLVFANNMHTWPPDAFPYTAPQVHLDRQDPRGGEVNLQRSGSKRCVYRRYAFSMMPFTPHCIASCLVQGERTGVSEDSTPQTSQCSNATMIISRSSVAVYSCQPDRWHTYDLQLQWLA